MNLTDHEKHLIARRAGGEYACIPKLRTILTTHRRSNRNLDDQIYLDFLAVCVGKKNFKWEEYEPLARKILELHPDPFAPKKKPKRKVRCRNCNKAGHNARSCPQKKKAITLDDGLPRLTPGWDPSKDVEQPDENTW